PAGLYVPSGHATPGRPPWDSSLDPARTAVRPAAERSSPGRCDQRRPGPPRRGPTRSRRATTTCPQPEVPFRPGDLVRGQRAMLRLPRREEFRQRLGAQLGRGGLGHPRRQTLPAALGGPPHRVAKLSSERDTHFVHFHVLSYRGSSHHGSTDPTWS